MVVNYRYRFEIRPGRFAYIPTDEHRDIAGDIINRVQRQWSPPRWCYHIGKRGGHIAALLVHTPNWWRARLDIEYFYGSVTRSKLNRALKRVGFSYAEANEIATTSTVRIGKGYALPYGFLQSSLLATLALANSALGTEITQLIDDGFVLSVYVDDIIVSDPTHKGAVQDAITRLVDAASRAAFTISADKTQGPTEEISVFNIVARGDYMMITDDRMLEFWQRVIDNGESPSSEAMIRYVAGVNEAQADTLRAELTSSI